MRWLKALPKKLALSVYRTVKSTLATVWLAGIAAVTVWVLTEIVLRVTGNPGLAERLASLGG